MSFQIRPLQRLNSVRFVSYEAFNGFEKASGILSNRNVKGLEKNDVDLRLNLIVLPV